MKFFTIARVKEAIAHLEKFDSNWIIVPLVLALHGANEQTEVEIKGADHVLDKFFNGSLIGLNPFDNGANSLRPRFSDIYPNMKSQGKEDDYVYHQPTKLWANVYSSRGYREMRMAGFLTGERSLFKLGSAFRVEWKKRISNQFRFEELLVWLFAFSGISENVTSWAALQRELESTYVAGGRLQASYQEVFHLTAEYPWPTEFTVTKPTYHDYQSELYPSSLTKAIPLAGEETGVGSATSESIENSTEGEDSVSYDETAPYPVNDVLIRTETRTVFEVMRRINAGKLILDPEFQRDFIWPLEKQSKLIESALMRIPLPVFYLAETKDGKMVVVDGLQRLTTFKRFLENSFTLQNLAGESGLNSKTYDELPPLLQTRLEDTNLILYLIDNKVPERVKLDIFERVNLGVPLSRQQMRNCIYVGPATKWLRVASKKESFLRATGGALDSKSMRDRECINRFCAFTLLGANKFKGDLDAFLASGLSLMNDMEESERDELALRFERSMRNNYEVFRGHAFRKHTSELDRRNPLNVALFDVFSVVYADLDEHFVEQNRARLRASFYKLMGNQDFYSAISSGTSDPRKVDTRFSLAKKSLQAVKDDKEA